jgi:di/tricarboxylate transporter
MSRDRLTRRCRRLLERLSQPSSAVGLAALLALLVPQLAEHAPAIVDLGLMVIAVGAGCDFLTPIGHQSNTLVMGPGGYRFGDYWRLGLPLSLIVAVLGTFLISWFWPLR